MHIGQGLAAHRRPHHAGYRLGRNGGMPVMGGCEFFPEFSAGFGVASGLSVPTSAAERQSERRANGDDGSELDVAGLELGLHRDLGLVGGLHGSEVTRAARRRRSRRRRSECQDGDVQLLGDRRFPIVGREGWKARVLP